MPLLALENLVVRYGEIEALHGLSLAVEPGEIVTLLGANGAGKSTTLRAISGLNKPAAGDIRFDGRSIAALGPEAIVKLGVSHVPEGRRIFPGLTARENVMLGASNRGRLAKAALNKEVDEMFDLFPDLKAFANALGWTLSGGQQQMVAVARGLMARPRLLLLDEPSLGLAPLLSAQIMQLIRSLAAERGLAVLLVEQNARSALSIAYRGVVLSIGRVVADEPASALAGDEWLHNAYLGGL